MAAVAFNFEVFEKLGEVRRECLHSLYIVRHPVAKNNGFLYNERIHKDFNFNQICMENEVSEGSLMPELKVPELGFEILGYGTEDMVGKCWLEGENVVWVDAQKQKMGARVKGEMKGDKQDDMTSMARVLRDCGYMWTEVPHQDNLEKAA